jgi:hypothetical protein
MHKPVEQVERQVQVLAQGPGLEREPAVQPVPVGRAARRE